MNLNQDKNTKKIPFRRFTRENHLLFIAKRQQIESERIDGNVIKLDEHAGTRALRRMFILKKKFNNDMSKVHNIMGDQYNVAENEFIKRAGDPNRYNEKTSGWVIWP